jgi:hypothetical protein
MDRDCIEKWQVFDQELRHNIKQFTATGHATNWYIDCFGDWPVTKVVKKIPEL